jgi:hypothetical protein
MWPVCIQKEILMRSIVIYLTMRTSEKSFLEVIVM